MERELARLVMALPDIAVAVSDPSGQIVLFSEGFRDILGELDPPSVSDLVKAVPLFDEHRERRLLEEMRPLARASRGEVVRDLVLAAQHTDGTWRHLRFNATPIRGSGNEIRGALALVQDVSSERRYRQEEADLRHRLITTINHHFRTPLTLVLGNLELLEEFSPDLPPHAQRWVNSLVKGAEQLQHLTHVVSELAELAATHDLHPEHADICPLLRRVVDAQESTARARGVTVRISGPGYLALTADLNLLARAVGALLRNAIQHAPRGTVVTTELIHSTRQARISITDQGPGVPASEIERLLQPFETNGDFADKAATRGLGLALAQAVATAHGGTLTLGPNHPSGLRADLTIPRRGGTPESP